MNLVTVRGQYLLSVNMVRYPDASGEIKSTACTFRVWHLEARNRDGTVPRDCPTMTSLSAGTFILAHK
jgi:hypothetical protein